MRLCLVILVSMLLVSACGVAWAQEEAHFEGNAQLTSPSSAGAQLQAFGLVTALYPPLTSNFTVNEYTWQIYGLHSQGSVLQDSVWYTSFDVTGSAMVMYEDPSNDARTVFYDCPRGGAKSVYTDGTEVLRGHFVSFRTSLDIHSYNYGQGTFKAQINWDTGSHVLELPADRRGAWSFGGTTTSVYSCLAPGDLEAWTGRIYQVTTPNAPGTWGGLRRMYR